MLVDCYLEFALETGCYLDYPNTNGLGLKAVVMGPGTRINPFMLIFSATPPLI